MLLALLMASASPAQDNPGAGSQIPGRQAFTGSALGRRGYESHCAACHGLDGRGGEHARGIADSQSVQARSDRALLQTLREGIPSAGMPSFRSLPDDEAAALVRYLRFLSARGPRFIAKGNPVRGREIFFGKGRCGDCHMMEGKGGFIAADLTDYAQSRSRAAIRKTIVSPDRTLAPGHEPVTIVTASGERFSGLVRNEDNFTLALQDLDGAFHLLMKSQVAQVERATHPLMPADYGTRLNPTELDDLVSYMAGTASRAGAPAAPPTGVQRSATAKKERKPKK